MSSSLSVAISHLLHPCHPLHLWPFIFFIRAILLICGNTSHPSDLLHRWQYPRSSAPVQPQTIRQLSRAPVLGFPVSSSRTAGANPSGGFGRHFPRNRSRRLDRRGRRSRVASRNVRQRRREISGMAGKAGDASGTMCVRCRGMAKRRSSSGNGDESCTKTSDAGRRPSRSRSSSA